MMKTTHTATMQFRVSQRDLEALRLAAEFAKEEPTATPFTRKYQELNPEFRKSTPLMIQAALEVGMEEMRYKGNWPVQGEPDEHLVRTQLPVEFKNRLDAAAEESPFLRSEYRRRALYWGIPNVQSDPYVHWVAQTPSANTVVALTADEWEKVTAYRSRSKALQQALRWFQAEHTYSKGNRRLLNFALNEEMESNREKLVAFIDGDRGKVNLIAKRIPWPKPLTWEDNVMQPLELPAGWTIDELHRFAMILWVERGCP